MNTKKVNYYDSDIESIAKLLHAMRDDPVINNKVSNILKMDSYPRRLVLNNWLEQLRHRQAPENLLSALSLLFDDNISKELLILIHNQKI